MIGTLFDGRYEMFTTELARAVGKFADLTQGLADSALERHWAWGAYDEEGVRFAFFRTYEELRELAAKTAAQRLAEGRPASEAQRILAQYHEAHRDLQAAVLGLSPEDADRAPAEGEWSVRRVVAHITGADLGFYGVTRYALDRHRSGDDRPAEIPDEAWDEILGQDEATIDAILDGPWAELMAYHEAFHQRVLRELADLSEAELAAPSTYWEGYPLSLRFRLHRFDSHLRQHTVQIDKTLSCLGLLPGEAKRLLRLIYAGWAEAEGAAIGAWDVGADLRREAAATLAARTEEIAAILA
jgi:uncharacterized damage-inducible protein DinB